GQPRPHFLTVKPAALGASGLGNSLTGSPLGLALGRSCRQKSLQQREAKPARWLRSEPMRSPDRARVAEALAWIDALPGAAAREDTLLTEAAGRILARDANSNFDLPAVDRAAVDGVAVHAEETIGASTYNPCVLQLSALKGDLALGGAHRINAGDPLPGGADTVIPLQHVGLE